MYYTDDILEEVRSNNDIVDVISSYIKIQKKGANYQGLCPFHNEKTPSFTVSSNKQIFYCFGCHTGGNVISFVMKYENLGFQEAVQYLAKRVGITLPEEEYNANQKKQRDKKSLLLEINKVTAKYFYYQLHTKGKMGLEYLYKRSLTDETIKRFGLGYANKTSDDLYRYLKHRGYTDEVLKDTGLVTIRERQTTDKFWNRIIFPILDANSRVIGFGGRVMGEGLPKYLNSPDTILFDKSQTLYGLNYARISNREYFLLCEGYMDVIALHQAGFTSAVASLGTAFTSSHANLLKRYTKRVILNFDSDSAGRKASRRAIPILREAGLSVRVLNMSPYKDPDDFIKSLGAEEFEKRIQESQNAFLWEIGMIRLEFDIHDPEQKTQFYREVAKGLAQFTDSMERNNYLQAVCEEYHIPNEDMRRTVHSLGEQMMVQQGIQKQKEEDREWRVKSKKETGLLKAQKLLLAWMIEDKKIYIELSKYISPEDFTIDTYREVAQKIYMDYTRGEINIGALLNTSLGEEQKQNQIAELLHTEYVSYTNIEEKKKAIEEGLRHIILARLERESKEAVEYLDMEKLQRVMAEQERLRSQGITIDILKV